MVSGRARQTRAPIPPKATRRESEAARGLSRQTPEMNNKNFVLIDTHVTVTSQLSLMWRLSAEAELLGVSRETNRPPALDPMMWMELLPRTWLCLSLGRH